MTLDELLEEVKAFEPTEKDINELNDRLEKASKEHQEWEQRQRNAVSEFLNWRVTI